jgi:hypothetical protein
MHTSWIVGLAIAASAIGLSAQQTSQPSTAAPLPTGGNQTMSVTGCVAQADTPGSFVLNNARMSNDSPTGTAQPSREDARNTAAAATPPSAATAAAASPSAMRYALSSTTDLKAHVGHQVEVTGRLAAATSARPGAVGTTGAPSGTATTNTPTGNTGTAGTAGAGTTTPAAPTFNVESVKMIAATCATP